MQEQIKAVAFDMDGTFLNSQGDYNRALFHKIVNQAKSKNVRIIVASGNELLRCQNDMGIEKSYCDYVCENGALVVSRTNEVILNNYLPRRVIRYALAFLQENFSQVQVILSGWQHAYILKNNTVEFKRIFHYSYPSGIEVNDFSQIRDKIYKITLGAPEKLVKIISQQFNQQYDKQVQAISSGGPWMDLINPGDDKANGLRALLDHFEILPGKLLAFGDGGNDLKMLQLAGYSYAMKNGTAETKKAAKFIAPSNDEDGVLRVIKRYLN